MSGLFEFARRLGWLMALLVTLAALSPRPARAVVEVLPETDCIEGGPQAFNAYFGYNNLTAGLLSVPVTPDNNLIISAFDSPYLGQPITFLPGRQPHAFSVPIALAAGENTEYIWVLSGALARVNIDTRPCPVPAQSLSLAPFVDCLSPPSGDDQATARFGYLNGEAAALTLPARSTFNYFGGMRLSDARAARGQPNSFARGARHAVFTAQFDPAREPVLEWRLMGASAFAALDTGPLPVCAAGPRLELDGSGQSTALGEPFARPLRARLLDAAGQPLAGVAVKIYGRATVAAQLPGAAATITTVELVTDNDGAVATTAIANGTVGDYAVLAWVESLNLTATFYLSNREAQLFSDDFEGGAAAH